MGYFELNTESIPQLGHIAVSPPKGSLIQSKISVGENVVKQ
jgi:hypothetical protein